MKNLFNKIIGFFKAVVAELKLVEFPTRQQTFKTGNTVLLISFMLGLGLYLVDWLFQIFRNAITTIKF